MTDDLTPEEREALANLPRERAPSAGLEERVVAAMRERGHLAKKPARVIRITTGRVAGLVAACVVLMVGAYSIGLNQGVVRSVLVNVEPQGRAPLTTPARDEEITIKPPAAEPGALRKDVAATNAVESAPVGGEAPPFEPRLNVPKLAEPTDAKKEQKAKRDDVARTMEESFSDQLASKAAPPAPTANAPAQLQARASVAESVEAPSGQSRTFALHGGTLIVDAPDSVRVVTDEQGRMLLIYTSNGVIRVRLAD